MPALLGTTGLIVAAVAALVSLFSLFLVSRVTRKNLSPKQRVKEAETLAKRQFVGLLFVWLSTLALTVCCVLLVVCFFGGDNSLEYVAQNRSNSASDLAPLYLLSGLWAGREGSLLFWAWLISVFSAVVALRAWKHTKRAALSTQKQASAPAALPEKASTKILAIQHVALDSAALAVMQAVLFLFLVILLLDSQSFPFTATASQYLDASGALTGNAVVWGMNPLLEHWAMAIHPPTLFVGYAGMTVPFAYAVAALVTNDSSGVWVERTNRYALVSWLFLGAGIGLGAVWAYVVLNWGGYWGWDPVENASLLSWGAGVALVHSMTVYRQRSMFKRWTIMLACLTFSFVIVGTFITRSGIVNSVHSFSADPLSLWVFGLLLFLPLLAGVVGLAVRGKSFADVETDSEEAESFTSKEVAYYFNNVILVVCMVALTLMTIAPALTTWMPSGGLSFGASQYNFIARILGVLYCLLMAVGPLFSWKKTDGKSFLRQARIPALCSVVLFAVFCVYFSNTLLPTYMQIMSQGGTAAQTLAEGGPFIFYAIITFAAFLAASLLFFNALMMLVRAIAKRNLRVQTIGGFLAHLSIGVIVIGLIGSSMYAFERSGYLAEGEEFTVRNYTLRAVSEDKQVLGTDVFYSVVLEVEQDGRVIGQITPQIQIPMTSTQMQSQTYAHSAVLSQPLEDLFVTYNGTSDSGAYSLTVHVNPLISFVWIGFGLLMVGSAISALGRRSAKRAPEPHKGAVETESKQDTLVLEASEVSAEESQQS